MEGSCVCLVYYSGLMLAGCYHRGESDAWKNKLCALSPLVTHAH